MESQYQKWANLSYLAAAALLAFILHSYGMKAASLFELESKLRNMGVKMPMETLMPMVSMLIAAVSAFAVYRNEKANTYMNEVVGELAKVTWPSQKDTTNATFIVLVTVIIAGVILGFLDFVWTKLLQRIF